MRVRREEMEVDYSKAPEDTLCHKDLYYKP